MRLVLDTNVLVAAMRSPGGASAALIAAAMAGRVTLTANVGMFVEYEVTLSRPQHLAAAGLSPTDLAEALDDLAQVVEPALGTRQARPYLPDPDDDMVLEAAINGRADAIVTFEIRTFAPHLGDLGIDVLTPREAWKKASP